MAENNEDSIFSGVFRALRRGRKDGTAPEVSLLTNVPNAPNPFDSKQQKQQEFLNLQSNKVIKDLQDRSLYYEADRLSSYLDFRAMDFSPEVSAALDILADECLEASTVIPLLNGNKKTIEELYNENSKNFWVYSYNLETEQTEPALCEKVAFKGEQDVYEIVFDDDSSVMATSEHLWPIKNGKKYSKTSELKFGDSIQPFYTRISTEDDRLSGYEMILENNGKWEYTHRVVKRKLWPDTKGVVHHNTFNKLNNEPSSLDVMGFFEHQKLHSSLNSFRWKNDKNYAEKMSKVFSETNSANGPYWSNPEWRKQRIDNATISMNNFISTTTSEQRKELYGLSGDKNGMYNNGEKLIGNKNGRYKKDKNHEFSKEELLEAFVNTDNLDAACKYLNTVKSILWKSEGYKNLNIQRWEDLDFIVQQISFEKIDEICNKFLGTLNLERNCNFLCEQMNWKRNSVMKFLKKKGVKNWSNYVKKFNSTEIRIENFKKVVLSTPGLKNIKRNFSYVCRYNNLNTKSIEGILSRSEHKNWNNFVDSLNHSIKSVTFIGKRKTYDLVNVGENHNFAILTSNGTGVFSHNCVTRNERGDIVGIYSENSRVKKTLQDLFQNVLNVNYNLGFWARELFKYGDLFLKLEVDQNAGIYDIVQLPVAEMHREKNLNSQLGESIFKWDVGNVYFEEWQVAHFRLLSDSTRLPYGRSVLDPARKLWKQLQLAEDAMLVYRCVRAPERRVYYIEVGNIDPADVPQYMEKAKAQVKKAPMVDPNSGNVNLKYSPITYEEDYFLPVRGDKSSRIETLPGASNLGDIADIEYLQNKLFAALKVPKPYLNYAETIPGGSALSQADLRFSRTVNRLQQFLVIELRRIANIHLYFLGFEDELNNFEITLANPSTQQELLKLETMKARMEVFQAMFTNDAASPVSYTWAMQYIMGFSEAEIKQIIRQKKIERKMFTEIEGAPDEYMETGIFSDLDRKFRKPNWTPSDSSVAPDSGGADAGAGGGISSGLGGGMGAMGGGMDMGAPAEGGQEGAIEAEPEVGGAEAGTEIAPEEPLSENGKSNKLQKNNAAINYKTKMLVENIEKHLKSLNEGDKENQKEILD